MAAIFPFFSHLQNTSLDMCFMQPRTHGLLLHLELALSRPSSRALYICSPLMTNELVFLVVVLAKVVRRKKEVICILKRDFLQRMLKLATRLAGKVALITGAAGGIGKTTAKEFINNGAKVVIADIQQELGQRTATELGPNALFVHCDVSQEQHVSDAVDFAISQHGQLDIMFNNAGVAGSMALSILDFDMDAFERLMKINVQGMIAGVKHAARVMVPRKQGSIICTASTAGVLGGTTAHPYGVSKFAVVGIVKSVSSELCSHGVRVNSISPFYIPTTSLVIDGMSQIYTKATPERIAEMLNGAGELEGAILEEVDVAKAALYLASDEAKYISGHNLVVDGGFTSFKRLAIPNPK